MEMHLSQPKTVVHSTRGMHQGKKTDKLTQPTAKRASKQERNNLVSNTISTKATTKVEKLNLKKVARPDKRIQSAVTSKREKTKATQKKRESKQTPT